MTEQRYIQMALELGFDTAVPCALETLVPQKQVRDMCASNRCRSFGRNWTCPPHCGTLEECAQRIQGYSRAILVQTVGHLEKDIDSRGYRETEQRHLRRFYALAETVRGEYPNALPLGAGGCRVCGECAWPEPCRFPDRTVPSMEGYGLFVTQVCRNNGLIYHHGERTVTYTSCILFGSIINVGVR